MIRKASEVWSYFDKKDGILASCKRCSKVVKHCGNTSNLHKHLKVHNINVESNKGGSKQLQKEISSGSVEKATGEKPQSSAHTLKEAFQKISENKERGKVYNNVAMAILYFICKDMRPFNIVEGQGFLRMMKETTPLYKVPTSKTFKNKLNEVYDVVAKSYKEKISAAPTVCLTTDVWTKTMAEKSFLGVTLHFIEGIEHVNCVIATRELSERHTAHYLATTLESICYEWGIPTRKIRCVITDNGANIVAAVKSFLSEKNHLPCFPHTLNLIVEIGLKNPNVIFILNKVRKIAKYVKNSVINSDKLRKIQIENGVAEGSIKKLILDVCTRWNSVYYMIERFIEMLNICSEILLSDFSSPEMPTSQEIEIPKQLIFLLKPFEYATKETSAENYITLSKVIPIINCITIALQNFTSSVPVVNEIAKVLKTEMARRFGSIENNSHVAISTLLDPRFKNINFQNPLALSNAIQKLRTIIKNEIQTNSSDSEIDNSPIKSPQQYDFWQPHKHLVMGQKRKRGNISQSDEVTMYLSAPIVSIKSNPLEEWEDLKAMFPQLYKQARLFLVVVASSVPCERLFSKAGATITQNRNRISSKNLEKLLFLGNVPQNVFFK